MVKIQSYMHDKCANELISPRPKYIHVWGDIIFDVFYSSGIEAHLSRMIDTRCANGEFESVTVDCAVKPTILLLGRANYNRVKSEKKTQSAPYAEKRRAVRSYFPGILRASLVGGADVPRGHIGDGGGLHGARYFISEALGKFYLYGQDKRATCSNDAPSSPGDPRMCTWPCAPCNGCGATYVGKEE